MSFARAIDFFSFSLAGGGGGGIKGQKGQKAALSQVIHLRFQDKVGTYYNIASMSQAESCSLFLTDCPNRWGAFPVLKGTRSRGPRVALT